MESIDFIATRYEVTSKLAQILHDPELFCFRHANADTPFLNLGPAERRPMNFQVVLNEGNSGVRNNGTGYLTVPDVKIGQRFLNLIRQKKIAVKINGRKIFFKNSHRRPSFGLLQTLKKVPYQDPSIDRERDDKAMMLDCDFRVDKLKFGVWSRRPAPNIFGIFCSEWEREYTSIGNALMRIEYEHKLIRIQLGDPAMDEIAYRVVLKFSNLQKVWVGYDFGNPCESVPML